ncbi:hypothetical protein GCM10022247_72680 [Allokutzneria multivorans]|uniref:Tetratricopeptide repeat protein n=1 Tax=Allokutzneria multivorans TaxID=1142134 RepID=A0ABP7U5Q9_9PSEU
MALNNMGLLFLRHHDVESARAAFLGVLNFGVPEQSKAARERLSLLED